MSSTDTLERSESLRDSERAALVALPGDDPIKRAAVRRLSLALEEARIAARALGYGEGHVAEQLAPLSLRADALLWRIHRERRAWAALAARLGLFRHTTAGGSR